VVTICTTRFNTNSTFCPHSVFMCFIWIWEQTAIISLYNINWLDFITETECVYCAVRTGSLYIIQQCSSRRKTGFSPGPIRLRFVMGKVTLGNVFSDCFSYPLSISFHQRSVTRCQFHSTVLFWFEGQTGEVWKASKSSLFRKSGCIW
jgi:hypothetical protein